MSIIASRFGVWKNAVITATAVVNTKDNHTHVCENSQPAPTPDSASPEMRTAKTMYAVSGRDICAPALINSVPFGESSLRALAASIGQTNDEPKPTIAVRTWANSTMRYTNELCATVAMIKGAFSTARVCHGLGQLPPYALGSHGVVTDISPEVPLTRLGGETLPLSKWATTFHFAMVVLDPYTHESAWILPTAGRILREFVPSDCRTTFLVTCDDAGARQFLGPWVDEMLVLTDPERTAVKGMGLERLPAFVHINQAQQIVAGAQGWNPTEWKSVADSLATSMSWQSPVIPQPGDPTPYEGTTALP